jgi:hypothetical protein
VEEHPQHTDGESQCKIAEIATAFCVLIVAKPMVAALATTTTTTTIMIVMSASATRTPYALEHTRLKQHSKQPCAALSKQLVGIERGNGTSSLEMETGVARSHTTAQQHNHNRTTEQPNNRTTVQPHNSTTAQPHNRTSNERILNEEDDESAINSAKKNKAVNSTKHSLHIWYPLTHACTPTHSPTQPLNLPIPHP